MSKQDYIAEAERHENALIRDLEELKRLRSEGDGSLPERNSDLLYRHMPAFRKDLTYGLRCLDQLKKDTKELKGYLEGPDSVYSRLARIETMQKVLLALATTIITALIGQIARIVFG